MPQIGILWIIIKNKFWQQQCSNHLTDMWKQYCWISGALVGLATAALLIYKLLVTSTQYFAHFFWHPSWFKVSLKIANNNWFNMESSIVLPSFGSKATAKWTDFHRLSLSPCFPPSYQDWRGIRQNVAIYSDFVGQQNFTLLLQKDGGQPQLWSFKQNLNS